MSNCELVNFLWKLFTNLNLNMIGNREGNVEESDEKKQVLFNGHIYKLHGDLDQ